MFDVLRLSEPHVIVKHKQRGARRNKSSINPEVCANAIIIGPLSEFGGVYHESSVSDQAVGSLDVRMNHFAIHNSCVVDAIYRPLRYPEGRSASSKEKDMRKAKKHVGK